MTKRTSLAIFKSVIIALYLREVQVRFGTQKLGYLWGLIDPFSQIIMFSLIKGSVSDNSMVGIDYPVFLASGFLAYNFFRAVMNGAMQAFNANRGLFAYKQVKPFDTIVSRFMLESLLVAVSILIFLAFGVYFELDISVKNIDMVLLGFIWIGVFGFSVGILFAVIGIFYETFAKIIQFVSLPLFFLSGLFYTVDSLPQFARELVLYNPVIHFIEMIHGNYFLSLDTYYIDYEYMIYWTLVPLFLGLFFYIRSEKKILSL